MLCHVRYRRSGSCAMCTIPLRLCCTRCRTDAPYASPCAVLKSMHYAMCRTRIPYARYGMCGTELPYGATRLATRHSSFQSQHMVLYYAHAMAVRTDIAHAAVESHHVRCARMVLPGHAEGVRQKGHFHGGGTRCPYHMSGTHVRYPATPCPVLTYDAIFGTDRGYPATLFLVRTSAILLRGRYAMCGTDTVYPATSAWCPVLTHVIPQPHIRYSPRLSCYAAARPCPVSRYAITCYAMSSTKLGNGAAGGPPNEEKAVVVVDLRASWFVWLDIFWVQTPRSFVCARLYWCRCSIQMPASFYAVLRCSRMLRGSYRIPRMSYARAGTEVCYAGTTRRICHVASRGCC
eukprot:3773656-Rhodomonas_salina.3